ncbi:MAG TPA: hypothetical protein VFE07_09495 [Marmoricola sp.]|nr:hypothetical protein [Marmoricola sp.]
MVNRRAVRAVVPVVVLALAGAWYSLSSDAETKSPAEAASSDVPVAQVVVPATRLAPVPVPPKAAPRTHRSHPKRHRAHAHRAHHKGRHAQRRAARHHTRRHATRPAVHARRGGGSDIGWPQCPVRLGNHGRHGLGQPMPGAGARFVIVGLTNGRSFTPNPCLTQHLRWVRAHHVYASAYAFATYPTRAQLHRYRHGGPYDGRHLVGALGNAGHAAARYNIRVMRQHGFTTPHVWLDVEPSSSRPWSRRHRLNGAVIAGWVRAYRGAGYTVGFYSTTNLWHEIVGRRRFHLPEWRTAGPASPRGALGRCREGSFQGGQAVVAQWWTRRHDFDRLCPSPSRTATLGRYFHKW